MSQVGVSIEDFYIDFLYNYMANFCLKLEHALNNPKKWLGDVELIET